MPFSPDLHVMAAPARAYAEAVRRPPLGRWPAVRRPALVALVLGTGSAFSSTGHLTLGLLLSSFACWSFVPLLQIATAAAVMRSPTSRSLTFGRRLDLWFMGHAPWSLWIFVATLLMGVAPTPMRVEWPLIAGAVIPIVWTSIIGAAYCRVVLGDSRHAAIARMALHQTITWTIALLYVGWAVALWPRIVALAEGK
jgi:hypothetical protein